MIKILIADDHAIVRGGLKQIIATTTDIVVAGEAAQGADAIEKLRAGGIDLLLLDMTMPGINGIDLIRRLRAEHPSLPILVLSIHNEGQVVSRALRAGATGYVTKDSDPEILLIAIRKLSEGGRFIDPKLVDTIVFGGYADTPLPHGILSDREFEVLQLLAAGISINDIAKQFSLSAKTISTHKMRLMEKLGLENNSELVRYAIKYKLVEG